MDAVLEPAKFDDVALEANIGPPAAPGTTAAGAAFVGILLSRKLPTSCPVTARKLALVSLSLSWKLALVSLSLSWKLALCLSWRLALSQSCCKLASRSLALWTRLPAPDTSRQPRKHDD
jgi:hypothetical protein